MMEFRKNWGVVRRRDSIRIDENQGDENESLQLEFLITYWVGVLVGVLVYSERAN